jgi:hypothetical protein
MTMSPANFEAMLPSGSTLGWLVVIRSPDPGMVGTLVELELPNVVLSREGGQRRGPETAMVAFKDEFMSVGHATVRKPPAGVANARFTIRDREEPGPSANGTLVNDRKLARGEAADLSDGDTILIGTTELLFRTLWLPPAGSG